MVIAIDSDVLDQCEVIEDLGDVEVVYNTADLVRDDLDEAIVEIYKKVVEIRADLVVVSDMDMAEVLVEEGIPVLVSVR